MSRSKQDQRWGEQPFLYSHQAHLVEQQQQQQQVSYQQQQQQQQQ